MKGQIVPIPISINISSTLDECVISVDMSAEKNQITMTSQDESKNITILTLKCDENTNITYHVTWNDTVRELVDETEVVRDIWRLAIDFSGSLGQFPTYFTRCKECMIDLRFLPLLRPVKMKSILEFTIEKKSLLDIAPKIIYKNKLRIKCYEDSDNSKHYSGYIIGTYEGLSVKCKIESKSSLQIVLSMWEKYWETNLQTCREIHEKSLKLLNLAGWPDNRDNEFVFPQSTI